MTYGNRCDCDKHNIWRDACGCLYFLKFKDKLKFEPYTDTLFRDLELEGVTALKDQQR